MHRSLLKCDCPQGRPQSRGHAPECPISKGFEPFQPKPEPLSERLVESARSIAAYKFKEWEDIGYDLSQCPYTNGTPEYAHWRRLEADKIDNAWSESQTWSGKVTK